LLVLGKRGCLEFYGPPAEYTGALETIVKSFDDTESSDTTLEDTKMIPAETSVLEIVESDERNRKDDLPDQRSEAGVWKYYLGKVGTTKVVVAAVLTITVGLVANFESELIHSHDYVEDADDSLELWLKWNTEKPELNISLFIGVYALIAVGSHFMDGATLWSVVHLSAWLVHFIKLRTGIC
jgi:hypothetical protein